MQNHLSAGGRNDRELSRCDVVCSRRSALRAMVLLGVAISATACDEDSPAAPDTDDAITVVGPLITIALARLQGLRAPDTAYVLGAQSVIVLRLGERDYRAFTNICTHSGCGISRFESDRMRCQCHGSEFDTDGKNVVGPAALPLAAYPVSLNMATMTLTITKVT